MQSKVLNTICCPVTRSELKLISFSDSLRKYLDAEVTECIEGVLTSESGWMLPVIGGIPRLQLDAFLQYEEFLSKRYPDFQKNKEMLLKDYSSVIKDAVRKTNKTRKSFGQEWAIFKYDEDKKRKGL